MTAFAPSVITDETVPQGQFTFFVITLGDVCVSPWHNLHASNLFRVIHRFNSGLRASWIVGLLFFVDRGLSFVHQCASYVTQHLRPRSTIITHKKNKRVSMCAWWALVSQVRLKCSAFVFGLWNNPRIFQPWRRRRHSTSRSCDIEISFSVNLPRPSTPQPYFFGRSPVLGQRCSAQKHLKSLFRQVEWYICFWTLKTDLDFQVSCLFPHAPISDGGTPDHLLLDSAPNLGPLIPRWEVNKFENCW